MQADTLYIGNRPEAFLRFSKNPEKNTAIIWFLISVGSLFLAFVLAALTFPSGISFARFYPPLLLATLSFVGIIIAIALYWSAGKLDALLSGTDLLLHWTYRFEEVAPYLGEEEKRLKKIRTVVLFFGSLSLFLGVLFCFTKFGVDYFAISEYVFLLFLMIVFLWYGLPAMGYGITNATDLYLGKNSILFAGRFHIWGFWGSSLVRVMYLEGKPAMLEITYRFMTENGSQIVTLHIPIPPQREREAKEAVRPLLQKMEFLDTVLDQKRF